MIAHDLKKLFAERDRAVTEEIMSYFSSRQGFLFSCVTNL